MKESQTETLYYDNPNNPNLKADDFDYPIILHNFFKTFFLALIFTFTTQMAVSRV